MPELSDLSKANWTLMLGLAALCSYYGLVWWADRSLIRRTNARWAEAHRRALRIDLDELKHSRVAGDGNVPPAFAARIDSLSAAADKKWPDDGDEMTIWVQTHEIKRLLATLLPDTAVVPRFQRAIGQIEELTPERARFWLQLHQQLNCSVRPAKQLRGYLVELLAELFNARDSRYNQLRSIYVKALWTVRVACVLVALLIVAGYGLVVLAGALGGLIGRLHRLVYAAGLPTAYGSSWVPLFCAPPLGALGAWAGLHLLLVLESAGVLTLQLGEAMQQPTPTALGLAALLGLSERFLNRVGQQVEQLLPPSAKTADGKGVQVATPTELQPNPGLEAVSRNGANRRDQAGTGSASVGERSS